MICPSGVENQMARGEQGVLPLSTLSLIKDSPVVAKLAE